MRSGSLLLLFLPFIASAGGSGDVKTAESAGAYVSDRAVCEPVEADATPGRVKLALSTEAPPDARFEAVRALAVSGYTEESARALADVACDRHAGESTRDYAAMGLGNFTGRLPPQLRETIRKRLRGIVEREKGDAPDGIVRTLIRWDDAPFVHEMLGDRLRGHGMEIEILAALPGRQGCEELWRLYLASPGGCKSSHYNRKAEIGRALASKNDIRGIDILIDLLPRDRAPGHQHRHNVFAFLAQKLKNDFGYNSPKYDPKLEHAVPAMVSWWMNARGTFVFAENAGKQ